MTTAPLTTDRRTINAAAFDAITAVEAATAYGLPTPYAVRFDAHGYIELMVYPEGVAGWAQYLGSEHAVKQVGLNVHHTTVGTIAGVTVTIAAVEVSR